MKTYTDSPCAARLLLRLCAVVFLLSAWEARAVGTFDLFYAGVGIYKTDFGEHGIAGPSSYSTDPAEPFNETVSVAESGSIATQDTSIVEGGTGFTITSTGSATAQVGSGIIIIAHESLTDLDITFTAETSFQMTINGTLDASVTGGGGYRPEAWATVQLNRIDLPGQDMIYFEIADIGTVSTGGVPDERGSESKGVNFTEQLDPGIYRLVIISRTNSEVGATSIGSHDLTVKVETPMKVKDASRFGNPSGGVPDVAVTVYDGEEVVAAGITTESGQIELASVDPELNLALPYDVWLEAQIVLDDKAYVVQRMYKDAVLDGPTSTTLVLPVTLHTLIEAELKKLETSGSAFIRNYDTAPIRALIDEWNSLTLLSSLSHKANDASLGRMLTALQGMAEAFTATTPLAQDAGKLFANTLLSLLAAAESAEGITKAAQSAGAQLAGQGTITTALASSANKMLVEVVKSLIDIGKSSFMDYFKSSLTSERQQDGVAFLDLGLTFVLEAFFEATADGDWDAAAGNKGGLTALLEGLAEIVGEKVGGGLLASGYVQSTDASVLGGVRDRAHNHTGAGTVVEGFRASQAKVVELVAATDYALSQSTALSDTAKGWGYVADVTEVGAVVPGGQVLASLTLAIRALNFGLLGKALATDVVTVYDNAKDRTPKVAEYAFTPPAPPAPASALAAFGAEGMEAGSEAEAGASPPPAANSVPAGYVAALSALRAMIVAGNHEGTLTALQALEAEDAGLRSAMKAALSRHQAAVATDPALASHLDALLDTSTELRLSISELYISLVGLVIPSFADPGSSRPRMLAQVDAVSADITAFDAAVAAAETASAGVLRPAYLLATDHGLDGASSTGKTLPGTATLSAQIVNAGDVAATGCTAQLTANNPEGPVSIMQLQSPGTQALADLAPGEARTVTWNVLLTDTSANSSGSAVSYSITLSGPDSQTRSVVGGIKVITEIRTPPILTLNGANPLVMDARPNYTDPGATAYDLQEGTVTPVQTGNNVIPSVPGHYTVTYSATDSTNLTTTATRNVQVVVSAPPAISAPAGGFTGLSLVAGTPLPDYTSQASASDNSGSVTVTQSIPPGTLVGAGALTITLTATDGAGNQATISFEVTVTPMVASGLFADDWPLLPTDMSYHNDLTAHPTNGWLYGVSTSGGVFGNGMIYRYNAAGEYQVLVHFSGDGPINKGSSPYGRLVLGSDGNFYGTTGEGGNSNLGTVFKMTSEGELTTLVSFTGSSGLARGKEPYGGVTEGLDGNFYGTTAYGGTSGYGTVFKITPAGVFTTLVLFSRNGATNKGAYPFGSLVLGLDGNFYGTTVNGGASDAGTIFQVTPTGELTTLVEFTGNGATNKGGYPYGSLTRDTNGDFYGMTSEGGTDDSGTIFKMTPAGVLTTLVEFTYNGVTNTGGYPYGDLTLGADGSFYGMTSEGATDGYGTVFKMTPAGVLTTLIEFTNNGATNKGRTSYSSLTLGPDGNFHGTTIEGGAHDNGTVFKMTPAGVLTTLMEGTNKQDGGTDKGTFPHGGLAAGPDGFLYGTTRYGGTGDQGTIFKLDVSGTRTTLLSFTGDGASNKGQEPQAGLTLGSDGHFYGVTKIGGIGFGTLFRVTTEGVLTTLVEFTYNQETNKGAYPVGRLVLGADGSFYGTTTAGGSFDSGTIFKVTTAGVLTTLVEYTGNGATNAGNSPEGGLMLAPDGNFYGTTSFGGANGRGTLFKMTPAGVLTTLVHLDDDTGRGPKGHLAAGPDGQLYGMTNDRGANGYGTIFKVSTNGVFTKLIDFDGTSGTNLGAWPTGSLEFAPDGNFYGMTDYGGANDLGTLFKMTPGGALTTLAEFKGSGSGLDSGGYPQHSVLMSGANGRLYGMTTTGGRQGGGMVYHLAVPSAGPEIAVLGNGVSIANGDDTPSLNDHTQFGLVAVSSSSVTRSFTLHNTGNAEMTLGSVLISGAYGSEFSVSTTPATSVPAGGSTTLGITFDPTGAGVKTAHLSFDSNDSDEASFGFFISGTGNTSPVFVGQTFSIVQGEVGVIPEASVLGRAWDIDGQSLAVSSVSALSAQGGAVTRSGGMITYTAPTAVTGADTFAISISDGMIGTPGTIIMNVFADSGIHADNRPLLSRMAGGAMRIGLSGRSGLTYGLLRSTDLVDWTQIATPTAGSDGQLEVEDPSPPADKAFYRIIFPPQ